MPTSTYSKRPHNAAGRAANVPLAQSSQPPMNATQQPSDSFDVDLQALPISPPSTAAAASLKPQQPMALQRQFLRPVLHNQGKSKEQVSARLRQQIQAARGSGDHLPAPLQQNMEQHFHTNLSPVRLHTDARAHDLAQAVQAQAFTTGPDIFLRRGSYQPNTAGAQDLLTHEVAHSIQQAQGPVAGTPIGSGITISDPTDRFEREAGAEHLTASSSSSIHAQPTAQLNAPASSASLPIQRIFYWRGGLGEQHTPINAETDDGLFNGLHIFVSGGSQISQQFLKYAKTQIQAKTTFTDLKISQIKKFLVKGIRGQGTYILEPPDGEKNLVEPLTDWLIEHYKTLGQADVETTLFSEGEKRQQWLPKPKEGEDTGVPGRKKSTGLKGRSFSFSEGMRHLPQFITSGIGSTNYTMVNDNGTYSIAAYGSPGGSLHFLGGAMSEGGKHSEEQQFEALESQIRSNSHNIRNKLKKETVVMHIHISKSPCADRCQGLILKLLKTYKNLHMQLYLEIPYMMNKPEVGVKEAQALNALIKNKKITGRLAYKVVSVFKSMKEQTKKGGPLEHWKEHADVMYAGISEEELNPDLAAKREGDFESLVSKGHLPKPSFLKALTEQPVKKKKKKKPAKKKAASKTKKKELDPTEMQIEDEEDELISKKSVREKEDIAEEEDEPAPKKVAKKKKEDIAEEEEDEPGLKKKGGKFKIKIKKKPGKGKAKDEGEEEQPKKPAKKRERSLSVDSGIGELEEGGKKGSAKKTAAKKTSTKKKKKKKQKKEKEKE